MTVVKYLTHNWVLFSNTIDKAVKQYYFLERVYWVGNRLSMSTQQAKDQVIFTQKHLCLWETNYIHLSRTKWQTSDMLATQMYLQQVLVKKLSYMGRVKTVQYKPKPKNAFWGHFHHKYLKYTTSATEILACSTTGSAANIFRNKYWQIAYLSLEKTCNWQIKSPTQQKTAIICKKKEQKHVFCTVWYF